MKNYIIASIFCLLGTYASAQTLGINYQAIILDSQAQEVPGVNIEGNPLANTDVYIRFYIFNSDTIQEFSDHHFTTTDEYGMINLLIGSGVAFEFMDFGNIVWDGSPKTLEVWYSLDSNEDFEHLATQGLSYTPHPMTPEDYAMIQAMQEDIDQNEADSGSIDTISCNHTYNEQQIESSASSHVLAAGVPWETSPDQSYSFLGEDVLMLVMP